MANPVSPDLAAADQLVPVVASKWEITVGGWRRQFFFHAYFGALVAIEPGHGNGFGWLRRAGVFTTAAANADRLVQARQAEVVAIWNGVDGLGRAVLGTGRTIGALGLDHAVIQAQLGTTNPGKLFVGQRHWDNGSIRANLPALAAVEITKRVPVVQARLHESGQTVFEASRL
jgi:hypothetical protein